MYLIRISHTIVEHLSATNENVNLFMIFNRICRMLWHTISSWFRISCTISLEHQQIRWIVITHTSNPIIASVCDTCTLHTWKHMKIERKMNEIAYICATRTHFIHIIQMILQIWKLICASFWNKSLDFVARTQRIRAWMIFIWIRNSICEGMKSLPTHTHMRAPNFNHNEILSVRCHSYYDKHFPRKFQHI